MLKIGTTAQYLQIWTIYFKVIKKLMNKVYLCTCEFLLHICMFIICVTVSSTHEGHKSVLISLEPELWRILYHVSSGTCTLVLS